VRVSESFLQEYRPIADALLHAHGLSVPDMTRDMLADVIANSRELPEPKTNGSHSELPALRTARTHAAKLIEYAKQPPARAASVLLRCRKLAQALCDSDVAVMALSLAGIETAPLLASLDAGDVTTAKLRRLVKSIDKIDAKHKDAKHKNGIGRPWAAHTRIIRAGCIAWERGGNVIGYQWDDDAKKLCGSLPKFLRALVACCDGTHELVTAKSRVLVGYRDPRPVPQGNGLRKHVSDLALRDGIRAWQKWCAKSRIFFS
jgi:hypothetical protein